MSHLHLPIFAAVCLAVAVFPAASARADDPVPTLALDPGQGPPGTTFTLDGSGFDAWVDAAHGVTIGIFDADNQLIDDGEVAVNPDGTIEAQITTDGYQPGTYNVMAFYVFWGQRRDPITNQIVCDFCPVNTVVLTASIPLTITP